MKKLILFILITGFFLIKARFVLGESLAGGSAGLLLSNSFLSKEQKEMEYKRKEIVIRSVLSKYGSPMVDSSSSFIDACKKYDLDCYLLPAIAGLESTFGKFTLGNSYNPFGWDRGSMRFDSWNESIDTVAKGLRENYLNKGAADIYSIGYIYSESPTWASRVSYFMNEFQQEEQKISLLSSEFPVKL